jgi:hypothetical protein
MQDCVGKTCRGPNQISEIHVHELMFIDDVRAHKSRQVKSECPGHLRKIGNGRWLKVRLLAVVQDDS